MTIHTQVTEWLNADPMNRVVVGTPGARRALLLGALDLPKIKPEGTGLRFGKLYLFACQLRFATLRHVA